MVNVRIDKYQFEEGYCQAKKSSSDNNKDIFTFYYYDQGHLGNIRQEREANGSKGTVIQTMNYYPFGAEFCDGSTKNYTQKHKYNGKEFDNMHGLNSYDYGARQYNPVTARWDRIDPLCEKYYNVSPYNYCMNNPITFIDPDGRDWYKNNEGFILWDPKVHSQEDLQQGFTYVGTSFYDKKQKTSYREDGTILFKKEKYAYQRMVKKHAQTKSKKYSTGKEQSAFILEDGSVLVMPDNWNSRTESNSEVSGYSIQNGGLVKGDWKSKIMGHVHTHSPGADKGFSHVLYGGGDDKFSRRIPGISMFLLQGESIYWGQYNETDKKIHNTGTNEYDKITNVLNGKISLFYQCQIMNNREE